MRLIFFLPFLLLLAPGCGSDSASDSSVSDAFTANDAAVETVLISNIDHLRLRNQAGPDGEVLTTLSEGDTLYDMGEVSDFTTQVTLRGIRFNEPWIRVRTRDSITGWVYAGGVHFQLDDRAELTRRLMQRRLQTFFGEKLAQRTLDYRQAYRQMRNSEAFAATYREARALRDTLVQLFDKRITLIQAPGQIPDLTWMEEALPGLIVQRVAEGTAFYLFCDYRQWLEKSRSTKEPEDDQLVEVCLTAFALDSVEYFLPAWLIPVSDEAAYSELGKGVHLQMLEQMNQAMAHSRLFEPEYTTFKAALLQDILGAEHGYWNDKEPILTELDRILAADFGLLTPAEKESLKRRRQQFEEPDKNQIRLNFRAGLYNE